MCKQICTHFIVINLQKQPSISLETIFYFAKTSLTFLIYASDQYSAGQENVPPLVEAEIPAEAYERVTFDL